MELDAKSIENFDTFINVYLLSGMTMKGSSVVHYLVVRPGSTDISHRIFQGEKCWVGVLIMVRIVG
jgi:hypothetical protein